MAWTQQQLDALDNAISKGVTEVRFGERTVRYRSIAEMLQIRKIIVRELGLDTKPRRSFPVFNRGL